MRIWEETALASAVQGWGTFLWAGLEPQPCSTGGGNSALLIAGTDKHLKHCFSWDVFDV